MVGGIGKNAINKLGEARIQAFIRNVRTGRAKKNAKLSDGGGMYLMLTSASTPVWRIKYRFGGEERSYTIGTLSAVPLAQARKERGRIKELIAQGRDPVQERDLARKAATASAMQTFQSLTTDWLSMQRKGWSSSHNEKSTRAFERDVLPHIGTLPVAAITPAMVADVIERIVKRGAHVTAGRILFHVRCVFGLGQARGLLRDNPAAPVHEVLPPPAAQRHHPALLSFPELGDVLRRAEAARLSPAVRMAHRLLAFSAARISNVVEARWEEFDLEADVPTWVIPRVKMKRKKNAAHPHRIILCSVIADELRRWRTLVRSSEYVFPSPGGGTYLSREALEKSYRETLGLRGKHSPHGWRASLSTLARDHGFDGEVVEFALDHVHGSEIVRAYDRGSRLRQRVELAAWWGNQLDLAERGGDVVPLKRSAA